MGWLEQIYYSLMSIDHSAADEKILDLWFYKFDWDTTTLGCGYGQYTNIGQVEWFAEWNLTSNPSLPLTSKGTYSKRKGFKTSSIWRFERFAEWGFLGGSFRPENGSVNVFFIKMLKVGIVCLEGNTGDF